MITRQKSSLGIFHHNVGRRNVLQEKRYELDLSREFYAFDVIPMGAPRMTQSDKWKTNPNHPDPNKRQRARVTQYFQFKNSLIWQGKQMGFVFPPFVDCVFIVPMPASWSEKKKSQMNGMPCKTKPDTDNMVKGIKDTFMQDDSHVWYEIAQKYWGYKGSIIIFT